LKKDDVVITISTIGSTKSYNLSKFIQKFILYAVLLIIISFGGGSYLISLLNSKLNYLSEQSKQLLAENHKYEKTIKDKKNKIEELGGALVEIEDMIGIKSNDETTLIQRAVLAQLTTAEKTYMLEVIPNGYPLKDITIVSKFGWRLHPLTKKKKFHKGLDLRAKRKTKIFATADGVVRYVQDRNKGQYGKMIIISHNFGFETVFAHLSSTKVKVGDTIKKGQIIARSGNSGRSTGPHLHYEVRYASKVLNPKEFMNWNLKNYKSIFKKQRRVEWESLIKMMKRQSSKLAQL
jgi:murein DD-endopeptidase MepM/ murein hydrolase activator NlpD